MNQINDFAAMLDSRKRAEYERQRKGGMRLVRFLGWLTFWTLWGNIIYWGLR